MMQGSRALLAASVLVGIVAAVAWFNVPLVPALTGGIGAGLLLQWKRRRWRAHSDSVSLLSAPSRSPRA